ncbi:MAG: polynucleotide adenylyltransferase PcnB [Planctomycetota bacterium]|nr:polynucleotide adenylyltransferase PcnB [Planctomycetota bacterium]MDP6838459.1 polynucleotide adenylyltransferase PcnB [Planctomycetota bacterium]
MRDSSATPRAATPGAAAPGPRRRAGRPRRSRGRDSDSDPQPAARPSSRASARIESADAIDPELLDQDALRVISRLSRQGHEAYMVGGCVRDLLIGRPPKDFDLATGARPRQVRRLFSNARIIGRRFRLVHVTYGDHIIETATFRCEPRQSGDADEDLLIVDDNEFGTAEEDARRRDFTVNGLFLDPLAGEIIDYVGGLDDLEQRVLRTIGDPLVRLPEDPVRILRAVKFATRLGFRIDESTWQAMGQTAPELVRSAPPRVFEEILRLMRSGTSLGAFRMLRACGALGVILPSIDEFLGVRGHSDEESHERADAFWRHLEALDQEVHQGLHGPQGPSAALCLALLFSGLVESKANGLGDNTQGRAQHPEHDAGDDERGELEGPPPATAPDLARVVARILDPVSLRARLSRRDGGRARRILTMQGRFLHSSGKRFRPLLFMRGEDFPEALTLFRLRTTARGQGWDIYEGWKERYRRARGASDDELDAERQRARRGSGRRRRRPRRRRRGGSN